MNPQQKIARTVGILFIIGTASGILSSVFLSPYLDDPNYLISVSENENQIVMGMLLVLVMGFTLAMIPVMLYPVFKKLNEILALGAVVFRGVLEAVMYIALAVNWVLLLTLSQEYVAAEGINSTTFNALGAVMLKADGWLGYVLSLVFSLGALMIYTIFYQWRLIPRWLSAWGLIGAVLYLASPLLAVFGFNYELLQMPLAIQEMVFALWLIVKGFNASAIRSGLAQSQGNERPAVHLQA